MKCSTIITGLTKQEYWYTVSATVVSTGKSINYTIDFAELKGQTLKVGDEVTLYLHKDDIIQGMELNGHQLYWLSKQQLLERHLEFLERQGQTLDEPQRKAEREALETRIKALPLLLQHRLNLFRQNSNPYGLEVFTEETITRIGYKIYLLCDKQRFKFLADLGYRISLWLARRKIQKLAQKPRVLQMKEIPDISEVQDTRVLKAAFTLAECMLEDDDIDFSDIQQGELLTSAVMHCPYFTPLENQEQLVKKYAGL